MPARVCMRVFMLIVCVCVRMYVAALCSSFVRAAAVAVVAIDAVIHQIAKISLFNRYSVSIAGYLCIEAEFAADA